MKFTNMLAAALALSLAAVTVTGASAAVVPSKPKPPREAAPSTYNCGNDLGHLRRVYEEQIDMVEFEEDVSIVPICENDDYGLMRSDGNAGALRTHLADNDAIMSAVSGANYTADDIVAVRMTGDDSIIVYVHTFHQL